MTKTSNGSGRYQRRVDCARAGERTKDNSCHLLSIYPGPGVCYTHYLMLVEMLVCLLACMRLLNEQLEPKKPFEEEAWC